MPGSTRINASSLSDENIRYSRHILLKEVGLLGQQRLRDAKVLVVGAGGLGSPVATYLATAGVGTLGMVDYDVVELSNLHRQILHSNADVGRSKLDSAAERIAALNPHIHFYTHPFRLDESNVLTVVRDYDLIVDTSDNFQTRYLVNDACVILRKTNIYASIFRFEGMLSVFAPHLGGPCYRCLYPDPPPAAAILNCTQAGVLGVVCGVIGTLQANEAIKWILQQGRHLDGWLVRFDALNMDYREIKIAKNPTCAMCGVDSNFKAPISYNLECEKESAMSDDVTVEWVNSLMAEGKDFLFIDVRNPDEYALCKIDGTILLPLGELPSRFQEIPKDKLVVLHCHHGGRSTRAVKFLQSKGYDQVKNLAGGIDRWSETIDPSIPKY